MWERRVCQEFAQERRGNMSSNFGIFHPDFKPFSTKSSRLATRAYPILGITKGRDDCTFIRPVFVSRLLHKLVAHDLGGAEVRILAHYSKCKALIDAFAAGRDPYQEAADAVRLTRKVAKAAVLARFYGASLGRLSDATGLSFLDTKKLVNGLDKIYPEIPVFSKAIIEHVKKTGFLETFSGRRFQFDNEHSPYKDAANRLAQATVSQMIQKAMVDLEDHMPWAPLWAQIHDEIINEIPEDRVEEFCLRAEPIITDQPWSSVRFITEAREGTNWGEL